MTRYYVYLDTSINQLLITTTKSENPSFVSNFNIESNDEEQAYKICQVYCAAYIQGTYSKNPPINNPDEFTVINNKR